MRLGSGNVKFQGCVLDPAKVLSLCYHEPRHVPDRDSILAYLVETGVDLEQDFSLVFDANGKEDVLFVFANPEALLEFRTVLDKLVIVPDGKDGCR